MFSQKRPEKGDKERKKVISTFTPASGERHDATAGKGAGGGRSEGHAYSSFVSSPQKETRVHVYRRAQSKGSRSVHVVRPKKHTLVCRVAMKKEG